MNEWRRWVVLFAVPLAWAPPIAADESHLGGSDLRGSASFSADWARGGAVGDSSGLGSFGDRLARYPKAVSPEVLGGRPARGSEQVPIECDLPPLPGTLGAMGCELWVSRYDGPGTQIDDSYWVIPSPDGSKVFVAGVSVARQTYDDFAVVAYDAGTGAELWVARWDGEGGTPEVPYPFDTANSLAVAPDGSRVFVTGHSWGTGSSFDYATVALDAATGGLLWVARHNGPGNFDDVPLTVTVAPDGSRVYVGGASYGTSSLYDYATVAYDAATGAELWVSRYGDPANFQDWITSMATSPDGSRLFVYGWSQGGTSDQDYATVAYDAATGAELWVSRYNGPGNGADNSVLVTGHKIAVSPEGARVVVTGTSAGVGTNTDHATVCYDAATGAELWVSRYDGPASKADASNALAFHPDGSRLFVTGTSFDNVSKQDIATRAIDAATGAQLWVSHYNGAAGNQFDSGLSITVGPLGDGVYVTGFSSTPAIVTDFATIAYDPLNGDQRWVQRYDGTGGDFDRCASVAIDPTSSRVYVTGRSVGDDTQYDYATVAYDATTGSPLWESRYNGPGYSGDFAAAMAVAPGTGTVYVTGPGSVDGGGNNGEYALAAYAPDTGAELWVATHSIDRNKIDRPSAVAVSPDGKRVYVSGGGYRSPTNSDYVTIAYEAAAGNHLWTSVYEGPAGDFDLVRAMVVAPDGARLFVTGTSYGGSPSVNDYATVAYDAVSGAQLWATRFDSGPAGGWDEAWALDVAPDGSAVYVTGWTYDGSDRTKDFLTIAYDAATGAELWQARTNGAAAGMDEPRAIRVSPDGARVFLTGWSSVTGGRCGGSDDCDVLTIALDAQTGAEQWRFGHAGSGLLRDQGRVMDVSPDGGRVFVAGATTESATGVDMTIFAHDPTTGAFLWSTPYFSLGDDFPNALQVSANGSRLYVAGNGRGSITGETAPDYASAALDAETGDLLWGRTYDGFVAVAAELAADGSRLFVTGTGIGLDWDMVTVAYFITQPPVASLSADPSSGEVPLTVTFSLGGQDAEGAIDSWKLDVDCDGAAEYGGPDAPPATLEHTYSEPGEYTACLTVLDEPGASGRAVTAVSAERTTDVAGGRMPQSLGLLQNAPNPLGLSTRIALTTTRRGQVSLKIYDIRGEVVRTLIDGILPGGRHEVSWRGDDEHGRRVASGVYVYRLVAEGSSLARKLTVAK